MTEARADKSGGLAVKFDRTKMTPKPQVQSKACGCRAGSG